jgi:hypothetical protein
MPSRWKIATRSTASASARIAGDDTAMPPAPYECEREHRRYR